jgi:hypothetical protein
VRKPVLLGVAFLRRVWALLPSEAAEAVEVTEQFLAGRAPPDSLTRCWAEAEDAVGQELWHSWEERSDWEDSEVWFLYIADPSHHVARFSARAANLALTLVRENADGDETEAWLRERRAQFLLYRDIVGDPADPTRRPPLAIGRRSNLAQVLAVVLRQQRVERLDMLALADALEEADCKEQALLEHCRESGPHFRGCWAVERLLGRPALTLG